MINNLSLQDINIEKSKKIISKIITFQHNGQRFSYLRKINHFVFEELILTAFENMGHLPIRNSRYTGDGGIDGQVFIKEKKYLIQAKRYSTYINNKDVVNFNELCRSAKLQGLFVHTGKTGLSSHKKAFMSNVDIVSGSRMISLVVGNHFYDKGSFFYYVEKYFKYSVKRILVVFLLIFVAFSHLYY
jgi:restriction system protein